MCDRQRGCISPPLASPAADGSSDAQPLDEATSFGPLISSAQRDKVLSYVDSGVSEGAKVATGGKKWKAENGGFYVEPTVLTGCKPSMQCVREEVSFRSGVSMSRDHSRFENVQIFGPVMSVMTFKSEEEALEMANDSIYGLAAGVFTGPSRVSFCIRRVRD